MLFVAGHLLHSTALKRDSRGQETNSKRQEAYLGYKHMAKKLNNFIVSLKTLQTL